MNEASSIHTIPLAKWIADGAVMKFWEDAVDKKRNGRNVRSDHHGEMVHMYSVLAGKSHTPASQPSCVGHLSTVSEVSPTMILPTNEDIAVVN